MTFLNTISSGEGMVGLKDIHTLTSTGKYRLQVDLKGYHSCWTAVYDNFQVMQCHSYWVFHPGKGQNCTGQKCAEHELVLLMFFVLKCLDCLL